MNAAIRPAARGDRALILNLFNMYQNEMGAYSADFSFLDENGYFAPRTADQILPYGNGVYPYIITRDNKNMGFLMVTGAPYLLSGCDWCFQELFVIARARGTGLAAQAARLAMEGRAGRWGLSVFEANLRARAFWIKLITGLGARPSCAPGENGMLDIRFFTGENQGERMNDKSGNSGWFGCP